MVARELLGTAEMKWCRMPMDRIEQVLGRKPTPEDDIENDRMFWGMKGTRSVRILGDEEGDVVDTSAFGDAGANVGDVIVAVNGERVQTMNQLATLMRFYRAGDVVTVTVVRDGEQVDLEVELASRPEGT